MHASFSLPSKEKVFELSYVSQELMNFLCEIPERYREIIKLYELAFSYGNVGYYPWLQIQACIKVAEFLLCANLNDFMGTFINSASISWFNETRSITAELASRLGIQC